MLVSEDEAKEKRCPFARVSARDVTSFNRLVSSEQDQPLQISFDGCYCIGSDCMAWIRIEEDFGYCGLARRDR